jgi:hypothetical protein
MNESDMWAEMNAARGGASESMAVDCDWAVQFNHAVCEQLKRLWLNQDAARWQILDGEQVAVSAGDGRRCDCEKCRSRSFRLRLYQVRVMREQERGAVERMIARHESAAHLYLSAEATELARRAKLLPQAPCLVHACFDELCLLSADARPAAVHGYNRLHTEELVSPLLPTTVYMCLGHERFHICDQACEQTYVGRSGELVCALSAMVKTAPDSAFTFGDGTARVGDVDVGGGTADGGANLSTALTREDLYDERQFGATVSAAAATAPSSRRGYGESEVLRERGSLVGRRRGRGHGSVVGGEVRSLRDRLALASLTAQSSGDDNALPAEELAKQFAEAARNVANVPIGDAFSATAASSSGSSSSAVQEGGPRQRKLRRAKRVKPTLGSAVAHTKLIVPLDVYRMLIDETVDESQRQESMGNAPASIAERLAAGAGLCQSACQAELLGGGEQVLLTLSVRATVPFGERSPDFNDAFLRDMLEEKRVRGRRLARFRVAPTAASVATSTAAAYEVFGTGLLFAQYGERACAIFWRLFGSEQRGAIERNRDAAAQERLRISVEAYSNERKRAHQALLAEDFARLSLAARESGVAFKRLVIDHTLWTLAETHAALLVTEFYLNMVSFVQQFADQFSADVADAVQTHFYFEHFVPVILFFMRNGFDVNGVVVLPAERIVVHEWFPETATLRALGVPEQTMTHLCSTVRAYVASARETRVSMRRLEATQLEAEELMALRLPAADAPPIENSHEFAEHAAQSLVRLFVDKRTKRLQALSR